MRQPGHKPGYAKPKGDEIMTKFTNPQALQILKEEQARNDAFFAAMDARIAKAQAEDIAEFIEEYQSGKSGIYPYHVALEVCARFNVPLEIAQAHVTEHIKSVLAQA